MRFAEAQRSMRTENLNDGEFRRYIGETATAFYRRYRPNFRRNAVVTSVRG
jgi:hypothetical protein